MKNILITLILLMAVSCGNSNNQNTSKEKTAHEIILSEGWSFLGVADAYSETDKYYLDSGENDMSYLASFNIYFKDENYTAIKLLDTSPRALRYPVSKGTYRFRKRDETYTFNARMTYRGDYAYLNF